MSVPTTTRQEATELAQKMGWTLLQARDYLDENPTLLAMVPENWRGIWDKDGFFLDWVEISDSSEEESLKLQTETSKTTFSKKIVKGVRQIRLALLRAKNNTVK